MENTNPPSALESLAQQPFATTHTELTTRVNKLLEIRQKVDSLLFKTIKILPSDLPDTEIFCPKERIKELELRTQRRNDFEEELFKDMFPTEEELAYHKELLDEPKPHLLTREPKIRRGDPWSLKIPCVIGTIYTGHAYIDLQSPVNIMSCAHYNKIREKQFQARRNPFEPYKFCNFIGRARNMHVFVGSFIYVISFMILEELGDVIDDRLGEVVLGKPFVQASKLTYDESLRLLRFAQRDDEVVFRMPQRTKVLDLVSPLEKNKFEAFFVDSLKVRKKGFKHILEKRKGYYKACMNLGRTYKRDKETIKRLKNNHHLEDIWWEYDDFGTVLEENGQGSQRILVLLFLVDVYACFTMTIGKHDYVETIPQVDFGPTHFRFFHFWLELDVCNDLVVQTWTHDGIVKASGFISFKKKLKNLKRVIRDWVISKKANSNKLKREHQSRLVSINAKVDQGNILDGPLILNEVMAWYRKRKKELMVFKVDFEKAFDSLSLEINVNKSNILRVGVPETIVSNMDYSIGCRAASFPMKYLGVPVGGNMALCYNRKAITQTFSSKLALWKACLSVGGRLCLIKSVLVHLPTYYMSIYPMPSTIAKKLESMCNQFFSGGYIDERKMSWVRWNKCLASKDLRSLGIVRSSQAFIGLMEASIILLLVALATTFGETLDSFGFSVASVRYLVDSKTLDTTPNATRWSRHIPIKVNIFIWRLMLNKLPFRVNLDRRGIDVNSILCPICQMDIEMINHIFFSCDMALDLWAKLARWWDLDIPICANIFKWFDWIGTLQLSNKVKDYLEGVGGT
ncbi:RNA-directed DNA polymerase, eukaryota, reverse transcriptase zinc-binding domain protein [Tanacetum coccineum]